MCEREETRCPVCGIEDDPGLPGTHLCSGMRPSRMHHDLPPHVRERLLAFFDEADRCRARGAAEARSAWIAGSPGAQGKADGTGGT